MPKYSYRCSKCEEITTLYHSINDVILDCELCEAESTLRRLPSSFTLFKEVKQEKVGSLVKRSIKDFREELEQEKKELKDELFEPD
jgi:putative FmdB family regulatory protein|tara:strand:+ start:235 stop:492 length:258 start_codon:yes stop_codon:yes gene_type:complete